MVDPGKLQQYLEFVRERGQAWWKPCAKFIEEIDNVTWFEFGLKVKSVEPKRREETEKQKNQPKPVLTALDEYGNVPVLVTGSPGAGKSTLLAKLLFEHANRAFNDPGAPIPVLIELKRYGQSGVWGLIQAALEVYDLYVEVPEIKQLVADKRLLLLADGVNELPEEKARLELQTFCHKQIPMIFTTRDLGGDLGIEQKLEIQPLRSDDVEVFLRDRLSNQDQKRVQELCDRVRDFGQTPLIVWMLYSIFQSTGEVPVTRGEAYRAFTTLYAERAKEGIPLEESRTLLAKLALEMMHSDKPTELRLDISERDAQKLVGGEKTLNHLLKHHLLERQGHPGNRRVRFCHQSLQEYYAAEALLQKLPDISDYTLKRDYLNYLKWTEAIALMLGLPEITDKQALQIVELALNNVDFLLGARLAGGTKPALSEQVVNLFIKLPISKCLKLRLLGSIGSNTAVRFIEEDLTDEILETRKAAVEALRLVGMKCAVLALIQTLKHADADTRCAAANALREIDGKIDISDLLPTLLNKQEDFNVRVQVAFVLSKVKDASAVTALLEILFDKTENISVRMNVVMALKDNMGSEVICYLKQALEDEDNSIVWSTVLALRDIGGALVRDVLREVLLSKNPWTRMYAASALALNKDDEIVDWIIQAIQNEILAANNLSFQHRYAVVNVLPSLITTLGNTGNKKAIPILCELSCWEDVGVCTSAIRALGKIGEEIAVDYLFKMLKHKDKNDSPSIFIRHSAVEALGDTGVKAVYPILLEAFEDESPFIRQGAISGLERLRLGNVSVVLAKALKDENNGVRERAAMAFDNIFDDADLDRSCKYNEAVEALIQSLEDVSNTTRFHAAQALWRLGDKDIPTDPLIKSLRSDQDPTVRMSAARALGITNSNDQTVKALTLALKDPDLGTRICASEALGKTAHPELIQLLWNFSMKSSENYTVSAIAAIQERCKFYNYEIAQSAKNEEDGVSDVGCRERAQVMKTILILASSPVNEARLRLEEEVREIEEALRRSQKRDQFKPVPKLAVRADDLRRALIDVQPQIVHFCGHGIGTAGLLLEDETGQAKPVSTEALATLFGLCADHVECVVLNACYSDVQAKAIVQQIPYVIGMQDAVGDSAAIKFATGFYDGLGGRGADGNGYETAYRFGCNAIQLENLPGHLIPKLLKKAA